jgi:hypothetical protein
VAGDFFAIGLVYPPQTKVARDYFDHLAMLLAMLDGRLHQEWPNHDVAETVIEAAELAKAYLAHVRAHGEPAVVIPEERNG